MTDFVPETATDRTVSIPARITLELATETIDDASTQARMRVEDLLHELEEQGNIEGFHVDTPRVITEDYTT